MFPNTKILLYDTVKKTEYFKAIKSILPGEVVVSTVGKKSRILHCGTIQNTKDVKCKVIPMNFFYEGIPSEDLYINQYQQFMLPCERFKSYVRAVNYSELQETQPLPLYYLMLETPKDFFKASNIFMLPLTCWNDDCIDNSIIEMECLPSRPNYLPDQFTLDLDFQKSDIDDFTPSTTMQKETKKRRLKNVT